jgi:hypothetical protein
MPAPFYAYTRSTDPGSGELRFDAMAQTWVEGQPMVECVLAALRTPRGQCLTDPAFGLDFDGLDKAAPNLAAQFEAAARAALAFLTGPGLITDLSFTVTAGGSRLSFTLAFTDPRDNTRHTTPRDLVLL